MRITILLLILLLMPALCSAYDHQYEQIWVYQGSFELGTGERVNLESYTIKLHQLDLNSSDGQGPLATFLLYKNNNYIDHFFADALANNEYIYEDQYDGQFRIIINNIQNNRVSISIYEQEYEKVWIPLGGPVQLSEGEKVQLLNSTVLVNNIETTYTSLTVSCCGESIKDSFGVKDIKEYPHDLMLLLSYIDPLTKTVTLKPYSRGTPDPAVEILGLKDYYDPNEKPETDVVVTNQGTIPLRGIVITPTITKGNVSVENNTLNVLEPGDTLTTPLVIELPELKAGGNISISCLVEGADYLENVYSNTTDRKTTINTYINIEKTVSPKEGVLFSQEQEDQEPFEISIKVFNNASSEKTITIKDSIPSSFIPVDLEKTEWKLEMDPESFQLINYQALPTLPGIYPQEAALASWDGSSNTIPSSTGVDLKVEGNHLEATRKLQVTDIYAKESVDVSIRLHNRGTKALDVSFRENIPEGLSLISGSDEVETNLDSGESKVLSYTLKADSEGTYEFPKLDISYTDRDGNNEIVTMTSMFLYVYEKDNTASINEDDTEGISGQIGHEPKKPGLTDTLAFLLAGFITLTAILSLIPLSLYLYLRYFGSVKSD